MLQWLGRRASTVPLKKFRSLHLESLEDRSLPSAALWVDLDPGLDADLFSDALFSTATSSSGSKGALIAALAEPGNAPAGNSATPQVGSSVSGSTAPLLAHGTNAQNAATVVIQGPTATLTVNTLADENSQADSTLSLREAIDLVDGTLALSKLSAGEKAQITGTPGAGSLINFTSGMSGTITLSSLLPLTQSMTIEGAGAISVSGASKYQIFTEAAGNTVTLDGLTLINGKGAAGGAINSQGILTVSNTTFEADNATAGGGAIYAHGAGASLTVTNSTFTGDTANKGGAIYSNAAASVSITQSTFFSNTAKLDGGAIADFKTAKFSLSNSSLTGNSAVGANSTYRGGAVYLKGETTYANITNCYISKNSSYSGGGISWYTNATYKGSLAVSNVAITGNTALDTKGGRGYGGGIYIQGGPYAATVSNCLISGNKASYGGGFYTNGVATVTGCLITANTALSEGGGIGANNPGNALKVINTTISNNNVVGVDPEFTPRACGGGLENRGTTKLYGCTVSGNTAALGVTVSTAANPFGRGGGLYNQVGTLAAYNCTIANNTAQGGGGGVANRGTATLINDTIAFNTAYGKGGGLYNVAAATITLHNTIVAQNTTTGGAASDISNAGIFNPSFNNLIGTGGSGGLVNGTNGNQVGVANPMLGKLANNGGLTQTIMLLPGSPALGAGSVAKVPAFLTTDQRGLPRIVGGKVDIGAVEVQPAGTPTHFVIQAPAKVNSGFPFGIDVTVEDDFGTIITGFTGTVTFTSTDNTATLPTPYTFTAADAGHHVFSATLKLTGRQVVFLTDAADKLTGAAPTTVAPAPASGAAFTDGINQLWVFENGSFINTGGFAKTFSAGIDAKGNAEVWFLDGINQLWNWDNGIFTPTGGFALHIAAGQGLVAFSDGINQLWTVTDAGKFTNTGGFASRFTASFDVNGNNQIVFADGINQLWTFNVATSTFTNTGGFTKLFAAGQDAFGNNEIWFTDGNNQIWRLDNGVFHQTSGFALTITGSAGGQMYFSDGINQIWQLTDFGVFTNTGGFASHISGSPGTIALFFSDGINQLWEFSNGTFTNTGGFAASFSAF
jgi:hypothetical protein